MIMRDDVVRLTLLDGTFDKLHQLQVRNGIHLYVRKLLFIFLVHTDECQCCMRIIIQLLVLRTERTRLSLCT